MKRVLVAVAAAVGLALLGGVGSLVFVRGWYVTRVTPRELSALLRPHDAILRPDGAGPFPVVLMFHGCGGISAGERDWARWFRDRGFIAVQVDSLGPRGLRNDATAVCQGRKLWGHERAGDVAVSLADVKKIPGADTTRVVLAGWSHGAWSIMDLLAMDRPTNLTEAPPLDGLAGTILFYPYCGFGGLSGGGWKRQVPSLMLLAEKDSVVSARQCEKFAARLQRDGLEWHTYPDVDHCFDMPSEKSSKLAHVPEAARDARERVATFLARVIQK